MCRDGAIRVRGIETTNLTAGYLEICDGREWRAVCDDGWDSDDATEVCHVFGFTHSKQQLPTNQLFMIC